MSGIRVIGGEARGRKLNLVPGDSTRPITDRVKEALFNILGADIAGATLLDLFAGTGSVGIEALSRGAEFVRFVDQNRWAVRTIAANLKTTRLATRAEVVRQDAFALLNETPDRVFDYVYIAPPQYKGLWLKSLEALDACPGWLSEDAWVIAQIDPLEYQAASFLHFKEIDNRKYGNTRLVFWSVCDS